MSKGVVQRAQLVGVFGESRVGDGGVGTCGGGGAAAALFEAVVVVDDVV